MWVVATLLACRPGDAVPGPGADAVLEAPALFEASFALTSLGARQVATPEEEEARAWVERALRATGLGVSSEPFQMDAWRPGTATLEVGGEVLEVEALSPSPATEVTLALRSPDEDFTGAAVLASDDDYPSRAEAFLMALGGGAAALIRVTEAVDHDGATPLVEVGHLLEGATMPGVAVDHLTGLLLKERLGQSIAISIAPDVAVGHTSYNVAARRPGAGAGTIYVVAHYDSWHPSESAFDNALGVGALVQLAHRVALAPEPDEEIVFLATSGEEQGLQGALAWVDDHRDEVGPEDLVIVLDVMWAGEGTYRAAASTDALRLEAIEAAAAEGLVAEDGGTPSFSSDHVPFVTAGASAIWLQRWPDRHYHTVADTLDNLDLDEAAAAMRANWRLLASHAGLEP